MIEKIVSGGQTGIDTIGLQVAKTLGLETGGIMPSGFRTENGPKPEYKTLYGMTEDASAGYGPRTRKNILSADMTVIFGNIGSTGSKLTRAICEEVGKLCLVNPDAYVLARIIKNKNVKTLNVAGNRSSKMSVTQMGIYESTLKTRTGASFR